MDKVQLTRKEYYALRFSTAKTLVEIKGLDTLAMNDSKLSVGDYLDLQELVEDKTEEINKSKVKITRTNCTTIGIGSPDNITIYVNMAVLVRILNKHQENLSEPILNKLGISLEEDVKRV